MDAAPSSSSSAAVDDDIASSLEQNCLMRLTKNELCTLIYEMHCALIKISSELCTLRNDFEDRCDPGNCAKRAEEEYPDWEKWGGYASKSITKEVAAYLIAVQPKFVSNVEERVNKIMSRYSCLGNSAADLQYPKGATTTEFVDFMLRNRFSLHMVLDLLRDDYYKQHRAALEMLSLRCSRRSDD